MLLMHWADNNFSWELRGLDAPKVHPGYAHACDQISRHIYTLCAGLTDPPHQRRDFTVTSLCASPITMNSQQCFIVYELDNAAAATVISHSRRLSSTFVITASEENPVVSDLRGTKPTDLLQYCSVDDGDRLSPLYTSQ